jgi:hypothetical protein
MVSPRLREDWSILIWMFIPNKIHFSNFLFRQIVQRLNISNFEQRIAKEVWIGPHDNLRLIGVSYRAP